MSAELLFDHDRTCWVIRESPRGPAGSAVVRLGGLLIAVDVAEGHLVEVVLDEHEADVRLSDADVGLLDALFGEGLARWLTSARIPEGSQAQLVEGSRWEAVRGLALSLLFQRIRPAQRRLVALDVALHAQRVGDAARDLLIAACWEALPALTALSQLVERHPQLLQRLSTAAVVALRERVGVASAVLATEGLAESSPVASRRLAGLASALSATRITMSDSEVDRRWKDLEAELAQRPEREAVTGLVPDYQFVAAPEPSAEANSLAPSKVVGINWSATTTDVAVRIGSRAGALLDGGRCVAVGRVPGQVLVRVPLRLGACGEDLADISVRLLTRRGELLARALLQLDTSEADLPLAVARLRVEGAAGNRLASDGDQVFVDLALDALPDLDSEGVAGLTRGQGFRAGQHAVAARKAGRRPEAVRGWQRAARLFELAGEPELARQAEAQAQATSAADSTLGWMAQVIEAVDDLARRVLAAEPAEWDELGRLGVELPMLTGATSTLAIIHSQLGRRAPRPGAVENSESKANRASHLAEAIRILRSLGDEASLEQARALAQGADPGL